METLVFFVLIFSAFAHAKPHAERRDLSEHQHLTDDPHYHDFRYDHEAFLGKQLAESFDKLTSKEAADRLSDIFDKIDKNGNSSLSAKELYQWIKFVSETAVSASSNSSWKQLNAKEHESISWEDYSEKTYGVNEVISTDPVRQAEYVKMKKQDKNRWNAADRNYDDRLDLQEYSAFLHPQEFPWMRDVVISETLSHIDTDHDGYISLNEYLVDLAKHHQRAFDPAAQLDPWATAEKELFLKYRDKDHDQRMNREEIGEWIMPTDYDPVDAEVNHLIYHADDNHNGELEKQEVMKHQDLFVGSMACNYGRQLKREEL